MLEDTRVCREDAGTIKKMWKHCENEEMKETLKRKAEELKDVE